MKAQRVLLTRRNGERRLPLFQVLLLVVATLAVVVHAQDQYQGDANANADETKPSRRLPMINNSTFHVGLDHRDNNNNHNLETVTSPEGVLPGAEHLLETYTGAAFEVYELPDPDTGHCRHSTSCSTAEFVIPAGMDAQIILQPDFTVTVMDDTIYAHQQAKEALEHCCNSENQEEVEACLVEGTAQALVQVQAEWNFQHASLQKLGKQLEGYICHGQLEQSYEPQTSPALESHQWESRDYIMHTVDILHKRPASQIHVIHNFIEPEECQAIIQQQTAAAPSKVDQVAYRQAPITIPWELESQKPQPQHHSHPLTTLSRRVYDYTQHVLNLNITEQGQEPLLSVQYYGQESEEENAPPDQSTAHCDGSCDGSLHEPPGRVATMMMFCQTANRGGHLHFANAGIHIQPTIGMGIFISYINVEQNTMDTGFTEHSACPVWEGDKHIVTQWMRLGVDEEHPWDSYDSLGNPKKQSSAGTKAEESVAE